MQLYPYPTQTYTYTYSFCILKLWTRASAATTC